MELSGVSPTVIIYIVASILPAIVAFGILVVVARVRATHLWLVPGWLAAAAIAPLLATFFGVRLLISTFSNMATHGGGIGSVSAGMWEAIQPSLFAGYAACGLALITLIIAIRAMINAESPTTSSTASTTVAVIMFVLAALSVAVSSHLFQHLVRIVTDVIDPHGPPMVGGVASTSQMLANQLTRAALVAAGSVVLMTAAVVISAVMEPKAQPSHGFGIFLAFATVLGVIGLVVNLVFIASWCSRLERAALTGQVVR